MLHSEDTPSSVREVVFGCVTEFELREMDLYVIEEVLDWDSVRPVITTVLYKAFVVRRCDRAKCGFADKIVTEAFVVIGSYGSA
jgi:hypothetical protein